MDRTQGEGATGGVVPSHPGPASSVPNVAIEVNVPAEVRLGHLTIPGKPLLRVGALMVALRRWLNSAWTSRRPSCGRSRWTM